MIPGAADLFQWNGSAFVHAASQTSLTFAYSPTAATIHISISDLNKTKAFKFGVIAASGAVVKSDGSIDLSNVHEDAAPDFGHGFWPFQLVINTPPPPPPPPPPPKPKPTPKPVKPPNPDALPTIFGPSSKSRKDPEYSRFATRMVDGPRTVFCWNASDWAKLNLASKKTITLGYVEYRSPRQINLAPNVCAVLDRLHYRHQKPPVTPAIAFGLTTLTHEMFHTVGVTNEAAAECYGMQLDDRAARLLGVGAAYGERVAKLAWRLYNPHWFLPCISVRSVGTAESSTCTRRLTSGHDRVVLTLIHIPRPRAPEGCVSAHRQLARSSDCRIISSIGVAVGVFNA
jgi:hypothetical protein